MRTIDRPRSAGTTERTDADRRLFARYRETRDPADRDAIVERFLPLARRLAAHYQRADEPFDDVFQVACYGLVKAVERFDATRGVAFSSYAVPTLTGEIKRYFRDRTWAVRVPRDLQDLALRVDRVATDLTRDLGRQPSVEEVARATGTEVEDVLEAREASAAYRATSLDTPRPGDDDGVAAMDTFAWVEGGYHEAEQRVLIAGLLRNLTRREREVVRLRFEHDLTQAEIGAAIGVSQMQVSRILRRSIDKLRDVSRDDAVTSTPAM